LQVSQRLNLESTSHLSSPTAELVAALLSEGIDVRLRLSGWSMQPLVPSGSRVQFSSRERPVVGDVVLVRHPDNSLVAHRLIRIAGDFLVTKGDACVAADGPVPRDRVVGCGVRLERSAGRRPLPLRSPWMRRLGLALSYLYPPIVARCRRGFTSFLARQGGSSC
jgi:hypothetical protein